MLVRRMNSQVNPELKRLSLGKISIDYSKHALLRSLEKHITLFNDIYVPEGAVVELERERDKSGFGPEHTSKVVVRLAYDDKMDLVLVLVPEQAGLFYCKTVWLNDKNDNHKTLNKSRLV